MTEPRGVTRDAHTDPRHTFLTGTDVIARFGWGRTYGYTMLSSTGFPKAIGGRYRLDTLMAWEDRVLRGELPGRPDPGTPRTATPQPRVPPSRKRHLARTAAQPRRRT